MAPVLKGAIDPREVFPGVIKVTPIPFEVPIHTRPVLHTISVAVNATFPFTSTGHRKSSTFSWGVVILFLFLALSLAIALSKRGWAKITGKIWKLSSGWKGSLDEEDDCLLQSIVSENTATREANVDTSAHDIQPQSSAASGPDHTP